MVSTIRSLGVRGVGGCCISVECSISNGLPGFDIVGLPDAAVKESRERVRAAIKNSGLRFPVSRLTVNLAPADIKKIGTVYDLPILMGILCASGILKPIPNDTAFIGELGLSGELRPVRGALPMAIAGRFAGVKRLFVPADNAREASYAEGLAVYPVKNLTQLMAHLQGSEPIMPLKTPEIPKEIHSAGDYSEVMGQSIAKRAAEVAVAGGHNILLVGPPGSGKSMIAKRMPGIMPDMTREEMLRTTAIHSVAGLTSAENPIVCLRPFRAPHHSASAAAFTGGAQLQPGEMSLANNGILFLDELPEFHRDVLETLRQPLEDGVLTVSRAAGSVTYPARFMLVGAMNPCRCGYYGTPRCRCTEREVRSYHARISGPLLDRIDIIIEVPALAYDELNPRQPSESSETIRKRVTAARRIQNARFGGSDTDCNAQMTPKELRRFCALSNECTLLMRRAYESFGLSARSNDRILRVARTIADLAGSENIAPEHIAEAIQYRSFTIENEAFTE